MPAKSSKAAKTAPPTGKTGPVSAPAPIPAETAQAPEPAEVLSPSADPARTVLHVGCGGPNPDKLPAVFRGPEWREVRLDIDANARPDIVASMLDMGVVGDASVDAVYSSHNLEHLYPHEVPVALREFLRVLKDDGLLLLRLPDLQQVAEAIANDALEDPLYEVPLGPVAPLDILYGFRPALARGNLFMAHRTGFTLKTLGKALIRAGFVQANLQRGGSWDLTAVAFKRKPEAAVHEASMRDILRPGKPAMVYVAG